MNSSLALVTGVPGWLGTRLVDVLLNSLPDTPPVADYPRKTHVRCLVQPTQNGAADELKAMSGAEIVVGDITARDSLAPFVADARGATVFHCAGVIHPSRGVREFYEVNVEGTRNLVDASRRAGVRRFVFVSSNSPIGTHRDPAALFDETAPFAPHLNYGKSKMLAEEIVNEAGRSGAFETVIVRPTWYYGPGQPPRQSLFFSMVRRGMAPIMGSGKNVRSMAYIDNVCQGIMLADMTPRARGETYWIADAEPYPMSEIVGTIRRVLERDFATRVSPFQLRIPGFVSEIAHGVDWSLQRAGFYHSKIHVLSEMNKNIGCTIQKAARELGYRPTVALEEGMRRSVAWMKERGIPF